MNAFYPAFSAACFSLLGLWLVVVGLRQAEWKASPDYDVYQKAAYGIALNFTLPALMSVLALVSPDDPNYWRASFAIVALGGAAVLAAMRGLEGLGGPRAGRSLRFPVGGALGVAAYGATIAGYILAAGLAIHGGAQGLLVEEILLTALVFLAFNTAWLLLFYEDKPPGVAAAGEPAEDLTTN